MKQFNCFPFICTFPGFAELCWFVWDVLSCVTCIRLCALCWFVLCCMDCVEWGVPRYISCAGLCELFWVWLCALLGWESQLGIRALDRSASRNFSLAPNLLFTHCSFTSGEVIPEQIPPQTSSQTGATLTVFFIKDARDEAPLTTVFKLVQYLLYSTWTWGKRKISSNNILRAGLGDSDHHLVLLGSSFSNSRAGLEHLGSSASPHPLLLPQQLQQLLAPFQLLEYQIWWWERLIWYSRVFGLCPPCTRRARVGGWGAEA